MATLPQPAAQPLTVRCQCGKVRFPTPAPRPTDLYHCHCTECQRQSASAFGTSAIFPAAGFFPLAPEFAAQLSVYKRDTSSGGSMDCWFCPDCGTRLFHRSYAKDGTPKETVSIKGGSIVGLSMVGAKHIYTRSAVIEVPKDCEQYETLPPGETDD